MIHVQHRIRKSGVMESPRLKAGDERALLRESASASKARKPATKNATRPVSLRRRSQDQARKPGTKSPAQRPGMNRPVSLFTKRPRLYSRGKPEPVSPAPSLPLTGGG